jgi:hypothetical protein
MAGKAGAIAAKMPRPEQIRALLRDLQTMRKDAVEASNDAVSLDSRISIVTAILQTIEAESKRGATDEEAILQGARKALDICLQIRKEALRYPQIGRAAYDMLPPDQIEARLLVLARGNTVLWIMGEKEEKNKAKA